MAAPTQEFPPWLTPSPSVVTDAAGDPVSTSTTIVYLPLTYFGPSVPLGSLWTFGGSTSPASTASATTASTASISSVIFSATPTSSSSTASTSSVSLLSSSSVTSSAFSSTIVPTSTSSFSSSTIGSSPTPSVAPRPSAGNRLTRGQLIGVIVASILGVIFLFVLGLAIYLWCKGRKNRKSRTRYSLTTPIDEDYFVVGPGGESPGEGSPRHSGEEADPFLQRSGETEAMRQVEGEMGSRPKVPRVPPPVPGSLSSSGSSSTNTSGYGELLDRPSLGLLPSMAEETAEQTHSVLSPEEMYRINRESVLPEDPSDPEFAGAYAYSTSPLIPPPRLVDPSSSSAPLPRHVITPHKSYLSQRSQTPVDTEESATLLTARRVRVDDIVTKSSLDAYENEDPAGPSSSLLGGLGLSGLANIGRLNWFKNIDLHRESRHSPTLTPFLLPDPDTEPEKGSSSMPDSQRSRRFGVGLDAEGNRPVSNMSGRSGTSGATIYHDAHSSIPGTPILASLPRALTPSAPPLPSNLAKWSSTGSFGSPVLFDDGTSDSPVRRSPGGTNLSQSASGLDILDMPAPSAVSNFVSASLSSLRESVATSIGIKAHPFPPGLDLIAQKTWTDDASTSATHSPNTFGVTTNDHNDNQAIAIEVLEEAPPSAGEGWRSMATSGVNETGRRTTFGLPQYVYQPDYMSEQGSLHSMRSHFSPSSRSTGSAPASRRDMHGSNSSRPSVRTGSSGFSNLHHLGRTNSVTSDGRRRIGGPISPAGSIFGQVRSADVVPKTPILGSPPSAHISPDRASTVRSVTSDTTAVGGGTPPVVDQELPSPLSPSFRFSNTPWIGGLDQNWSAA